MDRRRWLVLITLLAVAIIVAAVATAELSSQGAPAGTTVTLLDENGEELGTVDVRVADTFRERYVGLSETASLGPDEGMLFVHDREGEYAYVMRGMSFPIDIVFIGANGTITAIHHAQVEDPPLTPYRGRGKWVLEVPYRWTDEHGVSVGHEVRINRR